ncbi:PLD nuclease N-terminal domain-containing protein [Rhodococcoides kyotonense]|uniref:Phospholipase_D-nuclease N-terminal n=1 Tax=Rhodococcoides kyotonense TaxID=398843 RepID=A0A239MCV0_9NOCA|nr:PLD nuclease N-terminal domain-containing protein [Rhodococcus kyotonensis]SNT40310.1 Phospholipase_D-nuclease N-terminal [Rhodococcus kyotonensis]
MHDALAAWGVAAVLTLYTGVFLAALATCLSDSSRTAGRRAGWLAAIVVIPVVGPLVWLLGGRPNGQRA